MDLDPSTGLPRLEEGYYWEVVKGADHPLVRKVLASSVEATTKFINPTNGPALLAGPFLLLCKVEELEVKTVFGRTKRVDKLVRVIKLTNILLSDSKYDVNGSLYRISRSGLVSSWISTTPEDILNTARFIMTRMVAAQKREKARKRRAEEANKLFGSYPPKNLGKDSQ